MPDPIPPGWLFVDVRPPEPGDYYVWHNSQVLLGTWDKGSVIRRTPRTIVRSESLNQPKGKRFRNA